MKKIVGIACDNYKLAFARAEIARRGIHLINESPLAKGVTLIKVHCTVEIGAEVSKEIEDWATDKKTKEN